MLGCTFRCTFTMCLKIKFRLCIAKFRIHAAICLRFVIYDL
jgi:hypothetical protein